MKNQKSTWFIIGISLVVAGLHFIITPGYKGPFHVFIHSWLIDILLPMNVYLLVQVGARKHVSVKASRILGIAVPLLIGYLTEFLQYKGIHFLGDTFDPADLLMYTAGVFMGYLIDVILLDRLEKSA